MTDQIFKMLTILEYEEEEFIKIDFFNTDNEIITDRDLQILITPEMLANILNDYNITKRNKKWNKKMIQYLHDKMLFDIIDIGKIMF